MSVVYSHKIYLLFYTYLTEAVNSSSCKNKCCICLDEQRPVLSRITNYISPPFMHVKLAIPSDKEFKTISAEGSKGIVKRDGTFLHREGFSVLALGVTREEYDNFCTLMRYMLTVEGTSFSLWKMSTIGGRIRKYFLWAPIDYPTKDTKTWMCSEFAGWMLQEVGILPRIFHPTYISATELFLICANSTRCKQSEVNPYTKGVKLSKELIQLTNATYVYLLTMNEKSGILPKLNKGNCFAMEFIHEEEENEIPQIQQTVDLEQGHTFTPTQHISTVSSAPKTYGYKPRYKLRNNR